MSPDLPPDELLRRSTLFRTLERGVQDEIAARVLYRSFKEGDRILEAGAPGRALFVLLSGQAEVYAREGSSRFRVALLEPGALFGEIAFFSPEQARTADVVGREPGMVAMLSAELYQELSRTRPLTAIAMEKAVLSVLTDRLAETNAMMAQLMDRARLSGPSAATGWLRGLLSASR